MGVYGLYDAIVEDFGDAGVLPVATEAAGARVGAFEPDVVYLESKITRNVLASEAAKRLYELIKKKEKEGVGRVKRLLLNAFAATALVAYAALENPRLVVGGGFQAPGRSVFGLFRRSQEERRVFEYYVRPYAAVLALAARTLELLGVFFFPVYAVAVTTIAVVHFVLARALALLIRDPDVTAWAKTFLPVRSVLRYFTAIARLGVISVRVVLQTISNVIKRLFGRGSQKEALSVLEDESLWLEAEKEEGKEAKSATGGVRGLFKKLLTNKYLAVLLVGGALFAGAIWIWSRVERVRIERAQEEKKNKIVFGIKKGLEAVKVGAKKTGGFLKTAATKIPVVGAAAKGFMEGLDLEVKAHSAIEKTLKELGFEGVEVVEANYLGGNKAELIIKAKNAVLLTSKAPAHKAKERAKEQVTAPVRKLKKMLPLNSKKAKALAKAVWGT